MDKGYKLKKNKQISQHFYTMKYTILLNLVIATIFIQDFCNTNIPSLPVYSLFLQLNQWWIFYLKN